MWSEDKIGEKLSFFISKYAVISQLTPMISEVPVIQPFQHTYIYSNVHNESLPYYHHRVRISIFFV